MKNYSTFEYINDFKNNLEQHLGKLDLTTPSYSPNFTDAAGRILLKHQAVDVLIDVKPQISNNSQIKRLLELSDTFDGLLVVLSSSINSNVKKSMKSLGIGYHILGQEMYLPLRIEFQNSQTTLGKAELRKTGYRANTKLTLMLYSICRPESLQYSQRKLAQILGVSPTSIMNAQKGLLLDEIIVKQGRKKYLGNIREYVNAWRKLFKKRVKKQFLGRFSTKEPDSILMLSEGKLNEDDIVIGGEAAASINTGFLHPEMYTFHVYDDKIENFARNYRLWKDQNGPISIYKAFWPNELNKKNKAAPDLVVIAELLNSGNTRNIETAEILFKELERKLSDYVL